MGIRIPLGQPYLGEEEIKAIRDVINSKKIATSEVVKEFEHSFAKKIGKKYCITVNSGTTALWSSIKALGFKNSIILPAITCKAVLHAILNAGLSPIFADVDEETHNIDLSSVSEHQLKQAEAIIVTHTYGHSADMDQISRYVNDYQFTLIEDFAQATGGMFKDKRLGSFGDISITSFYGTKPLTTGHGGAILTDDREVFERCIYARGDNIERYYHDLIPMNLRMTDLQGAIGLVQLNKLDKLIKMRRAVATKLRGSLEDTDVGLPIEKKYAKHTFYKFPIVLPENMEKQKFIKNMRDQRIEVGQLYDPPLHKLKLKVNSSNKTPHLQVSETVAPKTVSLPSFPGLTDTEIKKISRSVKLGLG